MYLNGGHRRLASSCPAVTAGKCMPQLREAVQNALGSAYNGMTIITRLNSRLHIFVLSKGGSRLSFKKMAPKFSSPLIGTQSVSSNFRSWPQLSAGRPLDLEGS
eukprot:scaffold6725_cov92-Skeletonema_marinoi.AAC.1